MGKFVRGGEQIREVEAGRGRGSGLRLEAPSMGRGCLPPLS